jgi:predicted nucleic acid-binding protein
MIVYVETNFLLELAYLQEEHESCEELLVLAEQERVRLLLPAFCVAEARMSLARQTRERARFHDTLEQQIRQISRSKPYSDVPARSIDLISALIVSGEEERRRLDEALERLMEFGWILPTTTDVLRDAHSAETRFGLSPQDSVVYASVTGDFLNDPGATRCFLNRNSKDFADPDIYAELALGNCKLLTSFVAGLGYVKHAQ